MSGAAERKFAKALKQHKAGKVAAARKGYLDLLRNGQRHPDAAHLLALLEHEKGNPTRALHWVERAIAWNPKQASYHLARGEFLRHAGHCGKAVESLRQSLRQNPNSSAALVAMGLALKSQGQMREALECLSRAAQLDPSETVVHHLAGVLIECGQYRECERLCLDSLNVFPQSHALKRHAVDAMTAQNRSNDALLMMEQWVHAGATSQEDRLLLAELSFQQGDLDRALELSEELHGERFGQGSLLLCETYLRQGKRPKAREVLEFIRAQDGEGGTKTQDLMAQLAQSEQECRHALGLLRQTLLHRRGLGRKDERALLFTIARLLHRLEDYDQAQTYFDRANAIRIQDFDALNFGSLIAERIAFGASAPKAPAAVKDVGTKPRPLFIIGMPRSGTTLLERILVGHADISSAGEMPHWPEIYRNLREGGRSYADVFGHLDARAFGEIAALYTEEQIRLSGQTNQRWVIDKTPGNFIHLELIATAMPQARFIDLRRHPLDTCLSCYQQNFQQAHGYADSLRDLGAVYVEYHRLMNHWQARFGDRILRVDYESLVQSPQSVTESVLAFMDLHFDAKCLDIQSRQHLFANTASFDQVRQAIHTDAIARWRRYDAHLQPLLAIPELKEIVAAYENSNPRAKQA